jgi:D-alanine-D-alanine ligase
MTERGRQPADYGRVAVLMGGWSAEREVSLVSGRAVLAGLQRAGVDARGVDVGRDVLQMLAAGGFDRAFVVLHGRGGEDGVIQGALEVLGLPYTGSGVQGSAIAMDKYRCKLLWQGAGIPTPPFRLLREPADLGGAAEAVGLPRTVKPAHEGSSIGMTKVERAADLPAAWEAARAFDAAVLAERWVTGAEYTATILGAEALPLIRLETPRQFYDYAAKYQADNTLYHIPCGLPREREQVFQALALEAFRAVGARGWGRVDFLVDGDGRPWLIEVNTVPGMTDHSLVPMAAAAVGIGFDQLVLRILDGAVSTGAGGR